MASLLDIAPASKEVHGVSVYGVSARGIAHLLGSFPELRKLMSGMEVDAESLMAVAPDAIAAIIAAGVGKPGDAEYTAAADRLPVDIQADLLSAILSITMPQGVGPFVEKLASLGGVLGAQSVEAPATK